MIQKFAGSSQPSRSHMWNGFSLVEVAISTALIGIVILIVYGILSDSSDIYESGMKASVIEQNGLSAMDRITEDLRNCLTSKLVITQAGYFPVVSFTRAMGVDSNGATIESGIITYTASLESYEMDDGKDNNNNGLADEWIITRTEGLETQTLSRSVKEGNFQISLSANGSVTVTMVLQALDSRGKLVEKTFSTTIIPRNQ